MLATENALIRYSNRYYDLLKNERELYYAMQAFNRLDEQGDAYYDAGNSQNGNGSNMPPSKNGFFIRDDVPARFFTTNYMEAYPTFYLHNPNTWNTTPEYDHFTNGKSGFNYHFRPCFALSSGGLAKKTYVPDLHQGAYDYNNQYIPISHNDKENMKDSSANHDLTFAMSQDQVYRLLTGFATVVRTIPSGTYMVDTDDDGNGDTPFNFVEEAKIHCTNMIARMDGVSSNINMQGINDINCDQSGVTLNWMMVDPLGEKPGIGNFSLPYSPEVSLIWLMNYISPNNIPNLQLQTVINEYYHSHTVASIALNIITQALTSQELSNAKLALYTSLVSGFVPNKMQTIDGVFNHLFNNSRGNINHPDKYFGWHTYMMPLYCYLHNFHPQNNTAKDNWSTTRLDMMTQVFDAPCSGPYNYKKLGDPAPTDDFQSNYPAMPAMGNNGWNSPFRFDQRASKIINGEQDNTKDGGFFNGIDYMSEVNLFYITSNTATSQPTSLPFYQNLIDRYVDYDVSSDDTPMLGAFNSMSIHNSITGSGQLDIQAGSSIHLQDGTHITASQPSKHLFIKTFSCTDFNQNGSYELPQVTDSTLQVIKVLRPMNNDYGFNEVFPIMKYNVHPYLDNTPNTLEINQNMSNYNLNQSNTSDSIVLYPNPTENFFSIKNIENRKTVVCSIQIISMDGKIIQTEQIREKYDISELAPGTYIVHLQFPSGDVSDKKLIILP